jgi:hypothetical protein
MVSALLSLPALFVAVTVKVHGVPFVGVPEITPSDERDRPPGNVPADIDHVMGVSPDAVSVAL